MMTEQEWLECNHPRPMLPFLRSRGDYKRKAGRRKLRLFACACCRRVWRLLDQTAQEWIEWGERIAEGAPLPSPDEERRLRPGQVRLFQAPERARYAAFMVLSNSLVLAAQAYSEVAAAIGVEARRPDRPEVCEQSELMVWKAQSAQLRDIFSYRRRAIPHNASWPTPTVVALARAAYADRCLPEGILYADRLAVLADALEEAGCADAAILEHLRGPGPHVRGCWVVDLLLAKT